jgi:putative DNA primase/helicase
MTPIRFADGCPVCRKPFDATGPDGHVCDNCNRVFPHAETTAEPGRTRNSRLPTSAKAGGAEAFDPNAYPLTDSGNGELLAALYGCKLRYRFDVGVWLVWDGSYWREDNDGEVERLALKSARQRHHAAVQIDDKEERERTVRWAQRSEDKVKLEAAVWSARSKKPIADSGDGWDAKPRLLGVKNGVVNLGDGTLRSARPEDKITLQAGADYRPGAACPRWERFLSEVFAGDAELVAYVKRAVGYSLTGDASEQAFFLLHGSGENGKSVFLTALRHVFGSYAVNMPFSAFEQQARAPIPADVARLPGKRLATASETNEGVRLNEARIKALTGDKTITARHLYKPLFDFEPVAKIWLAVNDLPRVKDTSRAFWRRAHLLPFRVTFSGDNREKHLEERLADEAIGILRWAVEGACEWQESGLIPPAPVRQATDEWKDESDDLAAFLAARCTLKENARTKSADLYHAYTLFADKERIPEHERLTLNAFSRRMGKHFERCFLDDSRAYQGVTLLSTRTEDNE